MPGERLTLVYTGAACVDCVAFLANGDIPADRPDLSADIKRTWPSNPPHMATGEIDPDTGDSVESWFAWSACDCCGSTLGGQRERFTVHEWKATEESAV